MPRVLIIDPQFAHEPDIERAAAGPNTMTTFGGDLISPSLMSGLTKGSQMIELYNALDTAFLGSEVDGFYP